MREQREPESNPLAQNRSQESLRKAFEECEPVLKAVAAAWRGQIVEIGVEGQIAMPLWLWVAVPHLIDVKLHFDEASKAMEAANATTNANVAALDGSNHR